MILSRVFAVIFLFLVGSSCSHGMANSYRSPASNPRSFFNLCNHYFRKLTLSDESYPDQELLTINGIEVDVTPIKQYIKSSAINKKLRLNEILTPEEDVLFRRLSESLFKLPTRPGTSYRKVVIDSRYNSMEEFLAKYKPGAVVTEDAFTSVAHDLNTEVWGDVVFTDILFEIEGRSLRDFSMLNALENEGVYLPGSKFKVASVEGDFEYNKLVETDDPEALKEVVENYTQFILKHEELFEDAGLSPDSFNNRFKTLVDPDYGNFKAVGMRDEWEELIKQKIVPHIRIKLIEVD